MSFSLKLFRLKLSNYSSEYLSKDLNLPYMLDYDFIKEIDSRAKFFWKNLINYDDEEYRKFYQTELDNILKDINNNEFRLEVYDLTKYFLGYTLQITLNSITDGITLSIKHGELDIEENDLMEIKENNSVIFLGFVTSKETSLDYEGFYVQKITLANLGKIFSLAKISSDRSLADYAIKGTDLILPDATPFQDTFNNQNTFEIINTIMTQLYRCKVSNPQSKVIEYVLNEDEYEYTQSFNIMFPMMHALFLYNKDFYKKQFGEDYVLCRITNGKHKTYNEKVKASMPVILPTLKTTSAVISDITKGAMYDLYTDYDGGLNIRPPLYNYFPLEIYDPKNSQFKSESKHVIPRDDIAEFSFSQDNINMETRSDAFFTWPYVGTQQQIPPQFFEDIPALVKFGFRYDAPRNNPNAIAPKTSRLLAMLYNYKKNNATRTLKITVKANLSIDELKYEVGRLYYIDIPDMKCLNIKDNNINELMCDDKKTTNGGYMGYLYSISKQYKYGEFLVYNLNFMFIREVDFLNLEKIRSENVKNNLLDDLYNIYNKYGYIEEFQDEDLKNVSEKEFKKKKKEKRYLFEEKLIDGGWYKNIPIFRIIPSIIDLIELTYSDSETRKAIEVLKNKVVDNTKSKDTVISDEEFLYYRSYKFKLERFFRSDVTENDISFSGGLKVGEGTETVTKTVSPTITPDIVDVWEIKNYPYLLATSHYYDMISKIKFEDEKEKKSSIVNREDKQKNNSKINTERSSNARIYSKFISGVKKNNIIRESIEDNSKITNYQNNTAGAREIEFKNFTFSDNNKLKLSFGIPETNTYIYKFPSRLPKTTLTNDSLTLLTQKIVNRIIEMDAEMFEIFKTPIVPNMFFKYKSPDTNNELGKNWDTVKKGDQINTYSFIITLWRKIGIIDEIFNFPNGKLLKYMPKGVYGKEDGKGIKINDVFFGEHFLNNEYNENINDNLVSYYTPGFMFNMHTIIEYNTVMTTPREKDLNTLKRLGINENAERQKAHKDGRAIDFILPAQTSVEGNEPLPWIYFGLLGNYQLKNSVYEKFHQLLNKYFNFYEKTEAVIGVDLNKLKGIKEEGEIKKYAVNVYHIEVTGKNYIDPQEEVFRQ